nr:LysR family transcriptional regulator [Dubosiella newyorkensis]
MEFDQLEYLIAFGKYRTLSKAAEKLNISQPALDRKSVV